MIRQGEVYWYRFAGEGSSAWGRRPAVVVQDDDFNGSALRTTVVCAVSSNIKLAGAPGNVRLRRGEAGLSRPCVVLVTQLSTVDKARLDERIGTLDGARTLQVLRGLQLVLGADRER